MHVFYLSEGPSREQKNGGPSATRDLHCVPELVLSDEECKEAISLMKYSSDEEMIKKKMKLTFPYRRNMVLDPQQSGNILTDFPRFKNVKGLVCICK